MKLGHITVVVSDIEKSKAFYKEMLDLDCSFEKELTGNDFSKVTGYDNVRLKFAALKLNESGIVFELAQLINPKQKINVGFGHIAFEIDDLDSKYEKLKSKGVKLVSEPVSVKGTDARLDGKRFFYFRDPDGNLVELYSMPNKQR